MLEFIEPKQSALRDKLFKSHVMAGLNTIDESVRLISEVKQDFSGWKQVTTDLLRALEDKACKLLPVDRKTLTLIDKNYQLPTRYNRGKLGANFGTKLSRNNVWKKSLNVRRGR